MSEQISLSVSDLRRSRTKPVASFTKFAQAQGNPKFQHHLFCFFEGKDNAYYIPRIERYCPDLTPYPISCDGRDNVLTTLAIINGKGHYVDSHKAFFIDRDFNTENSVIDSRLYETPCYSIENLYVNPATLSKILINQYYLSEDEQSYQNIMDLFDNLLTEFNQSVLLFNAWYACLVEHRNSTGEKTGVQLTEKVPKELKLTISLSHVQSNYDLDKLNRDLQPATNISQSAISVQQNQWGSLNKQELSLIFRGKYQLAFLLEFLQLVINDSKKAKQYIPKKIKFDFDDSLNHQRALQVFSHEAQTPESLKSFLKSLA